VTLDAVRRDTERARRGVGAALVVLLFALLAAGLLVARGETQQHEALTRRFDARQATASRFLEAYVQGVFATEGKLAARAFTGAVSAESFATIAADQGYDASVLVGADGSLMAVQPANPAVLGPRHVALPAPAHSTGRTVGGVACGDLRSEPRSGHRFCRALRHTAWASGVQRRPRGRGHAHR
jgi:hypothetical protein